MTIRIALTFLVLSTVAHSYAQSKQYVCIPCGANCDTRVYDRGGTCRSCGMELVEKSTVNVQNLTLSEMCARIKANPNVVLLDVRSASEFKGNSFGSNYGSFKNAININIDDLERRVGELSKYKNEEMIVYCSHSHRSPRATYILSTKGFTNVKNMAGGVSTFDEDDENECLKSNYVFH